MSLKTILSFIAFINCLNGFAQTGRINGKVILQDTENLQAVLQNTYVILESKTKIDSVKLNKDLTFVFENLSTDTLKIYFSPQSYPINTSYRINLKEREVRKLELKYFSTCPFGKSKDNICPVCGKKDKVVPIVYGLTYRLTYKDSKGNIVDKDGKKIKDKTKVKYKSGGCIVTDCQPELFCERNNEEF